MKLWVSKVGGDDKVRSPTYCSRLITDSRRIKKKKRCHLASLPRLWTPLGRLLTPQCLAGSRVTEHVYGAEMHSES